MQMHYLIYLLINYIFQLMLEWCQNQQQSNTNNHQIILLPIQQTTLPSNNHLPKFINQRRSSHHQHKKGIKLHFNNHPSQIHQQTQTQPFQQFKSVSNSSTQTEAIVIHALNSKRNSLHASKQTSPKSKGNSQNLTKPQFLRSEMINTLEISKNRTEMNRQTKASYNLLQSKNQYLYNDDNFNNHFRGVQSYHLPQNINSTKTNNLPHHSYQQRMVQSIRNAINQQQEQNTFSQKYKTVLRNVQSQFKLSSQKISQINLKYTPQKRILFLDRQTIISKYGQQHNEEQRSFKVQQSLVYDRDIRSPFTPIAKPITQQECVLTLAIQNSINLIVSIKEISVHYIAKIAEELLIYRQMEQKRIKIDGILSLYQTQIDRNSYMFIKEPFTDTMDHQIQNATDLSAVYQQIEFILTEAEKQGLMIRAKPKIQDFVVCFSQIKIHNASIFSLQQNGKIIFGVKQALQSLTQQVLQRLL